jgi:hypothetical protein
MFPAGAGEDFDAKFYEGLRRRGMFSLVEDYFLAELAKPSLLPELKARYRLELSRAFMDHAGHRLGEEQAELWEQARKAAEAGLADGESTRWFPDLLLQRELISVEQARFGLQQLRLTPTNSALRTQTTQDLRAALANLREAEKRLDQIARTVVSEYRKNSRAISPYEHRMVEKQAILEIARTLADIAEVQYDSVELRGAPLRAAASRISVLTEGSEDESATWQAKLLEIRCSRLVDDFRLAQQRIDRIRDRIPDAFRDDLLAEQVRLHLGNGSPDNAAELLRSHRTSQGVLRGELALLSLQSLSSLANLARERGDQELSRALTNELQVEAGRIRNQVGGIWAYRCAVFMELQEQTERYGAEYAEQLRLARNLYEAGEESAALEAYRSLSRQADRDGRGDLAAEMAFLTGSLELSSRQWEPAGETFQSIVQRYPESPRAAEAHLMWAYVLGKHYEAVPTRSNREAYTQALETHLGEYASSRTIGEAHMMLGQLQEKRLQITQAVAHYLQVPSAHEKSPEAELGAVRCYQKILDRLKELEQPTDAWRIEAIDEISRRVAEYPEDAGEWGFVRAKVVLGLSRLLLARREADYPLADRLLSRVISIGTPDDAWKELELDALRLRVLSLAGAGKTREAEAVLLQLERTGTDQLLSLLEGLNRVTEGADASVRGKIAEMQLKTSLELRQREDSLTEAERKKLGICLAQAYLAAERSREAREEYERLVEAYPREIPFREQLARLYRDCPTDACAHRALELWRSVESSYRQGSSEWFRARGETIAALISVNRRSEAERLLKITETLYPELGGPQSQADFVELKTKLGRD